VTDDEDLCEGVSAITRGKGARIVFYPVGGSLFEDVANPDEFPDEFLKASNMSSSILRMGTSNQSSAELFGSRRSSMRTATWNPTPRLEIVITV